MFGGFGEKIKKLAFVVFVLGVVASIVGFVMLFTSRLILRGIIVLICGIVGSYIIFLFVSGYGQLIENSDILVTVAKANLTKEFRKMRAGVKNENGAVTEVQNRLWRCPKCGLYTTSAACPKCGLKCEEGEEIN